MASLQIDNNVPDITPAQSLNGWRREFCVELLGEGVARISVRAVQHSSFKASELQRAVLFCRLDPRFDDLDGCVLALQPDLERLADTAQRTRPAKENLFRSLEFDPACWERVQAGVERWARGQRPLRSTRAALRP
jgi:hypothetical protein